MAVLSAAAAAADGAVAEEASELLPREYESTVERHGSRTLADG